MKTSINNNIKPPPHFSSVKVRRVTPELKALADRVRNLLTATETVELLCEVRDMARADVDASPQEKQEPVLWLLGCLKNEITAQEDNVRSERREASRKRLELKDELLTFAKTGDCFPLELLDCNDAEVEFLVESVPTQKEKDDKMMACLNGLSRSPYLVRKMETKVFKRHIDSRMGEIWMCVEPDLIEDCVSKIKNHATK